MPQRKSRKALVWAALGGALLVAGLGAGLVRHSIGDGLARLSYDLPFALRYADIPADLVLVDIDSKVKLNLQTPPDEPLNRRLYIQLLRRLKRDGARLVLFDILFDEPAKDAGADQEFATAMREFGGVVLVADYVKQMQGNAFSEAIVPPIPLLAEQAAAWGLARLSPDPGDSEIRLLDPGTEACASAGWMAARLLKGADALPENQRTHPQRWLNYYCPTPKFRSVNFDQAVLADGLPTGYFKDAIVVVGSRPEVSVAGAQADAFSTPFSRLWWRLSSGAEIHAMTLLNLTRGDWLRRMPMPWTTLLVVAWGLAAGCGLMQVRPWHAAWLALAGALMITAAGVYCQIYRHVWWPWMVPVAIQTPLAFIWSVGWQYAVESRRRRIIKRAFAAYTSPHLADRIADEDFDLSLGGKLVEATVMFTDLAGFTAMSESLNPQQVSTILTTYFSQTTRGILEYDGMIIKYMGDAVMAVWGAPLEDSQHPEHAVRAGWAMIQAGRTEIAGQKLHTRIGINTGQVLAGNLGSEFRFDYAAIGDTTNLASRLEGLNKYLGTDILISEATRRPLGDAIKTRCLGRFILAGKSQPVTVHEIINIELNGDDTPAWSAAFGRALQQFNAGAFEESSCLFSEAIQLRGGHDGPSDFYLKQIATSGQNLQSGVTWDGVIRFAEK